jgi:hypothetical protein
MESTISRCPVSSAEFKYPVKLDDINNNLHVKVFLLLDNPDFAQISLSDGKFSYYDSKKNTFYFFITNHKDECVNKGNNLLEISFVHDSTSLRLKIGDSIYVNFVNDDNPDEFVKGLRTPKQIGGGTTVPVIAYP